MFTLQELAERVGGLVEGAADTPIAGVRPFEEAGSGDLTLAVGRTRIGRIGKLKASAVIVGPDIEYSGKPLLKVQNPRLAFALLLQFFHDHPFQAQGISPLAVVGEGCRIPREVTIEAFVSLGKYCEIGDRVTLCSGVRVGNDCSIGDDSVLFPNAVLYDGVRLGARVRVHSGAVLGADGFGYVFDGKRQVKIPQTGTVVVEDDVEIGANSCIDRGTFGATLIRSGVKIDNHVHVGHNCTVGRNTVLVAQVGISGSVEIGENCTFAGHSGVVDHVRIGDGSTVLMKSGVSRDVAPDSTVSGSPAQDHRRQLREQALIRRLPELFRRLKALNKEPVHPKRNEEP